MKKCNEWWCENHHVHLMCCKEDFCFQKVHVHHCCIIHGCKYNYPNCGVALGKLEQKYLCEDCNSNLSLEDNIRLDPINEEEYF